VARAHDPADLLTDVVPRLYRVLRAALDEDPALPSLEQLRVMTRIAEGVRHASGLAAARQMRMSAITPLIDSLVARGWVRRTPDPEDRRRTDLGLTPEGERARRLARRRTRERLGEVLGHAEGGSSGVDVAAVAAWLDDALRRYDFERLNAGGAPRRGRPGSDGPRPAGAAPIRADWHRIDIESVPT
jgi:DNA-binding MarR family transcriptional regulator